MSHKICAVFNMLLGALLVILTSPIKLFLLVKENFSKTLIILSFIVGSIFAITLAFIFPSGMLIGSCMFAVGLHNEPKTLSEFGSQILNSIKQFKYQIAASLIIFDTTYFLLYKNLFYPNIDGAQFGDFFLCNILSSCITVSIYLLYSIFRELEIPYFIRKNYEKNLKICKMKGNL